MVKKDYKEKICAETDVPDIPGRRFGIKIIFEISVFSVDHDCLNGSTN